METTRALGFPAPTSNVWQLQHHRRQECSYKNVPIKNGDVADVARKLPDAVKEGLRTVDLRSIDPVDLAQLAGMLHREGYLSHDAAMQLLYFQLDFKGPMDPLSECRDALESLRESGATRYPLAVELYEAAIDALEGLEALVDCLNGRAVDVYA
jgi:hypothetical protein